MRHTVRRWSFLLVLCGIGGLPAQDWWVDVAGTVTPTGSAQAPWRDLPTALSHSALHAGDTIFVRPGIYRGSDVWIRTDGVRLTRDPAHAGRVILDGGVAINDLCNRTAEGLQKTTDNGARFTKVLGVAAGADGVTIDGLEVRNGYVGIFTEAADTRILDCHVHHTSQNGISSTGERTEIASNIVHDVVLYNLDGQCLTKARRTDGTPDRDTRKKVVRADGTVTTSNMDWGQGITCKGDYPRDPTANYTKIGADGLIHDNLLWNAWSEGFGTFCSRRTTMASNTAFNIWRVGYYVQNADAAVLDSNLTFFHDTMDAWALRGNVAFANELDRRFFATANPTDPFLLPDTSGVVLRNNFLDGGNSGLVSVFGKFINTQTGQQVTISGNLVMRPPASEPCMELGAQVRGLIRVTGNVLLKDGADATRESLFIEHRDTAGAVPAQAWTIAGNRLAGLPSTMATVTTDEAAIVTQAALVADLADDQDTASAIARLRTQVATLRHRLEVIRAGLAVGPNTAPRILHTAALRSNLVP